MSKRASPGAGNGQQRTEDDPARGHGDNVIGPAGAEHLRSLEARIMSLLESRDAINEDIKEVFQEVKDSGFETKTVRKVIAKKRAMDKDPAGYRSAQELEELYFATLYQPDLPFESLNPGLAENRKKTAKSKTVVPALTAEDPGGPTADEAEFA